MIEALAPSRPATAGVPTCHVRTDPKTGRLLVRWQGVASMQRRRAMLRDWRSRMVAPRFACWRAKLWVWSVQPAHLEEVWAFAETWRLQVVEEGQ